jgi:hypothetical protein
MSESSRRHRHSFRIIPTALTNNVVDHYCPVRDTTAQSLASQHKWFSFSGVSGGMVFSATFNNISAISWRSVVLVTKTWVPGENHRPVANKLYHIIRYRVHLPMKGFELTTVGVIGTDCFSGDGHWLDLQLPRRPHPLIDTTCLFP